MIIDNTYTYIRTTFTGSNGTWTLVGTDGTAYLAKDAIDTFRNIKTGEYKEVVRCKVKEMQDNGIISAF